jgi:Phage tail lysozyme
MTEAYKVGVKLAMTSNAPEMLAVISKSLLGINTKVTDLTKNFGTLGKAIGGALGVFAGEKILSGLTSIVEKTADLSHELTQIQKLGGSLDNRARANAASLDVTRNVLGINQKDVLEIFRETYSLIGQQHALEILPLLSKYGVVAGNTTGDLSSAIGGSRDLVRAAEQMGRLTNPTTGDVDTDRFKHFLDIATKVGNATGGAVNAHTWYQLAQQGAPALMGMNDQSLMTMAILSQYMGGPRAGTAMMSTFSQFAGGVMFKRSAEELQRLGMLKPDEWSTSGGRVILSPEAKKRLGTMFQDPLTAVTQSLLPAMQAQGITSSDDQIRELFSVLGRQTSQREIADIARNWKQMIGEMGRMNTGLGLEGSYAAANSGDVEQNLSNLSQAWKDFWYAVAGPNSEREIAALKMLTGAVTEMTEAARNHPEAVKAIAGGLAAVGVLLVGAGGAAILAALGVGGWFVLGIGALGAAFVTWGPKIKAGLEGIIASFESFIQKLGIGKGVGPGGVDTSPFTPMSYTGGGSFDNGMLYSGGGSNHAPPNFGGMPSRGVAGNTGSAQRLMTDLVGKYGWSPEAAAVMAGNVQVESGFNTGSIGDGGTSFGLAQWHNDRARRLKALAGKMGVPWTSWEAQVALMNQEWRERYGGAVAGHDFNALAHLGRAYEGYSTNTFGARVGAAEQYLHNYLHGSENAPSAAIPPAPQQEIHFHHKTTLDGNVVARSTMKRIIGQGNMPSSGGRVTDIYASRPMSI